MTKDQERDISIEQMSIHLFEQMKQRIKEDRQLDALAICEEFVINGIDPQEVDTEYIFIPNTTFGDWTWNV